MSLPRCSLCNRPAAWLILDSLFCEVHKEKVIESWGVDRFPIRRFDANEKLFTIRGRHKRLDTAAAPRSKLPNP